MPNKSSDHGIALDAENTVQGMMERVFTAEARSPDHSDYDQSQVLTEMRNMRQVFENRLKNPAAYEARSAVDMIGIVTAPNQFQGFTDYPQIGSKMQSSIDYKIKDIIIYTKPPIWHFDKRANIRLRPAILDYRYDPSMVTDQPHISFGYSSFDQIMSTSWVEAISRY